MSKIKKCCQNYENFERIVEGIYANIYKAQNKQTKSYIAIKEIDKNKYQSLTKSTFNTADIKNTIKNENIVKFKSTIDSKDYFYIIMDLCINNLEEYIKSR